MHDFTCTIIRLPRHVATSGPHHFHSCGSFVPRSPDTPFSSIIGYSLSLSLSLDSMVLSHAPTPVVNHALANLSMLLSLLVSSWFSLEEKPIKQGYWPSTKTWFLERDFPLKFSHSNQVFFKFQVKIFMLF